MLIANSIPNISTYFLYFLFRRPLRSISTRIPPHSSREYRVGYDCGRDWEELAQMMIEIIRCEYGNINNAHHINININMNEQQFNPQLDLLKHQLHTVFTYYCSFGDRDNFSTLKLQNYRRMLTDAQLLQHPSDHSRLDILYASYPTQSGLTFDHFLAMLPQVLGLLTSEAVHTVLHNNFHALYEYILENTDFGEGVQALRKEKLTESCFLLLRELSPTLQKIFISYFEPFKLKQNGEPFKSFVDFLRDFELIPHLVSMAHGYLAFKFLQEQESAPAFQQWFTLQRGSHSHHHSYFKFIESIIMVSSLSARKINGLEMSPVRNLVTLLEVMEISKGFAKLCRTQKINLRLIVNEALVKKLERNQGDSLENFPSLTGRNGQIAAELSENYNELRRKFVSFCVQGQTLGQTYLTHKKAIDILQEMNLGLRQNQIEVYLAHASGRSIDFQLFISILQKIQEKGNFSCQHLTSSFLAAPLHHKFEADQLRTSRVHPNMRRDEYKACLAMVESVHLLLSLIFRLNSEPLHQPKGHLSFISLSSYLKIMHDFEVTPLYLSKSSLIQAFQKSIKKSQGYMDFTEFKDSFVVCLPYVEEPNCQAHDEKLLLILEHMNESRGTHKLAKTYPYQCKEDYLSQFRTLFWQYYRVGDEDAPGKHSIRHRQNLSH